MDDWQFGDPFEETPARPDGEPAGAPSSDAGAGLPGPTAGDAGSGLSEPPSSDAGATVPELPLDAVAPPPGPRPALGGGSLLHPIGGYTRPPVQPASDETAVLPSAPETPGDAGETVLKPPSLRDWRLPSEEPHPLDPAVWREEPEGESAAVPQPRDEDADEAPPREPRRRTRSAPPPKPPSGGKLWAFAIVGLVVGLLIGAGVLAWLRVTMLADQRRLEGRLQTVEASATVAADEVASLTVQLDRAEASMAALASQNSSLAAQLESATAALSTANSKLADALKTLTITERSASPGSVVKDKPLVLEVKVQGTADKVQMKLVGVAPVSYSKTYSLTKVGTSAGVQTWRRTVEAPSTVGVYRYYATAYIGSKEFTMPGVSAWTFEVTAGP